MSVSTGQDGRIRVVVKDETYVVVPELKSAACNGCAFFRGGISVECSRATHALRLYYKSHDHQAFGGCSHKNTIFIHDSDDGWAKFLKVKLEGK